MIKTLISAAARLVGVSPLVVWLIGGLIAAGGLGVVVWRIHAAGYAAGEAHVQSRWDAAVKAEAAEQARANREARDHQAVLARAHLAAEAATSAIVTEISNAPALPDDPDRLGLGRVRDLNRIR